MVIILSYLVKGFFVGLVVSVPLGPMGLVIIENTLTRGIKAGLTSATTVASVDIIAAGLVLLGLHSSIPYFHSFPSWVHILGSAVIFGYGFSLFKKKVRVFLEHQTLTQSFLETLLLIVSNPATYFSFGIITILFGPALKSSLPNHLFLFTGFIVAVVGWWGLLVIAAEKIKLKILKTANLQKIIGVCLMVCAIAILILPGHGYFKIHHLFNSQKTIHEKNS